MQSSRGLLSRQEMPISFPQLYLAGGVTTMRTAGSLEPQNRLEFEAGIKQGKLPGLIWMLLAPTLKREGFPVPEMLHIAARRRQLVSLIIGRRSDVLL